MHYAEILHRDGTRLALTPFSLVDDAKAGDVFRLTPSPRIRRVSCAWCATDLGADGSGPCDCDDGDVVEVPGFALRGFGGGR